MMRLLFALTVVVFPAVFAYDGSVAAKTRALRTGDVSGTAFLLGPFPEQGTYLQLHTTGDTHPNDWKGARDAEFVGLADVVVSAIPVHNPSAANPSDPPSFPETGALVCEGTKCEYVTVATGNRLELYNYGDEAVSLNVVKDGRIRLDISIDASQTDPPALVDISSLETGVYEIIDPPSKKLRGWLYRAAAGEIVVGPTGGNCRYTIALTPGKYRIRAWHPHFSPIEQIVKIRAGIITRVNPVFSMKNLQHP